MYDHRIEIINSHLDNSVFRVGRADGFVFRAVSMLQGFDVSGDIGIGPFLLRKTNKRSDLKLGQKYFPRKNCILEMKFKDEKTVLADGRDQETPVSMYVEPFYLYDSFYHALQVYVDSWVGIFTTHYFLNRKEVGYFGNSRGSLADSLRRDSDPIIQKLDKEKILGLMKAFNGDFRLAISRYSMGCGDGAVDSILDFVICLESLLLHKINEKSELSFRFSLRGAHLLSRNGGEKNNYFLILKYLYDVRSGLAHGAKYELRVPTKDEEKDAFMYFGVEFVNNPITNSYMISDLARRVARKVLLTFIFNKILNSRSILHESELGIYNAKDLVTELS